MGGQAGEWPAASCCVLLEAERPEVSQQLRAGGRGAGGRGVFLARSMDPPPV